MSQSNDDKVVYFAKTDARNREVQFGIKKRDRSRHMYAIGKTGMGKSTLLENLAVQDIQNGDGLCFIDPHGKSADLLLEYVPKERIKDVIYFAPFDMDYPVSFNVMEDVGPEKRYLVASGLMASFKKIWVDAWSARMEYILGNIMLALLEYPGSTLVGVNRMLTDKDFRKEVVNNITDPSVKSFWVNEYASYTDKFAAEAAPAIQNKVGQFIANPLIRNIIGQEKSSFDIRKVMDEKKILIINLSKGRVGEANANLLGSMLITKIYLGAMSRADLNEKELAEAPNFYLYVDEFQSFANESFADILSEARKYKLNLTIAHQYIEQMTEEVRAAVFGNVGSMCVFRVGAYDAEVLEKEFAPQFTAEDIVNLQKYQMYLKLMIDGVTSSPFSATGMPPIPKPEQNYVQEIIESSRSLYAKPRQVIEEEIMRWHQIQFGKQGGSNGGNGGNNGSHGQGGHNGHGGQGQGGNGGHNNGNNSGGGRSEYRGGMPSNGQNQGHGRPQQSYASSERRPSQYPSNGSNSPQGTSSGQGFQGSRTSPNHGQSQGLGQTQVQTQGQQGQQGQGQGQQGQGFPAPTTGGAINTHPQNRMKGPRSDIHIHEPHLSARDAQHKKDRDNQRENEFRKAISLNYLKPEVEPKVESPKAPRPENIAALREALLSVMNNAEARDGKKEDMSESEKTSSNTSSNASSNMTSNAQLNEQSHTESMMQKPTQKDNASHHNPSFETSDTRASTLSDRVDTHHKSHSTDTHGSHQHHPHSTDQKEAKAKITEEELKKILDIE